MIERGDYMIFSYLLLALCVSIDSLGIGITYGLKNTKISIQAKCILFFISTFITSIAVFIGDTISRFLPNYITNFIGSFLLCLMGSWMMIQAFKKKKEEHTSNDLVFNQSPKMYQFFIRFLGITIQIIRNPNSSDMDHSNRIDGKEAIYLGIALSLDSIGVGIGSSVIGLSSFLFPLLVATFQFFFLSFGSTIGKKIKEVSNIPENIWSIVAGVLLIFIGIGKWFL